jgi:hypothetical protein
MLCNSSCNSQTKFDAMQCDEKGIKSAEFINEYFFSDETNKSFLDSAQYYLDDVVANCYGWKYYQNMVLRKLDVLSLQRKYGQALSIIDTIDWEIQPPYFLSVLKKRFEAMQLLFNGDTSGCNDVIKSITTEVEGFLASQKREVDSVLKLQEEDAFTSPLWYSISQYYYYKFKLCTSQEIEDNLMFLEKSGVTKDIIDWLKPKKDDNFLNYEEG